MKFHWPKIAELGLKVWQFQFHRGQWLPALLLLVMVGCAGPSAQLRSPNQNPTEPAEDVAVAAIVAMNRGDGAAFAKLSHTIYKLIVRKVVLGHALKTPLSPGTKELLAAHGFSSVDQLELLPLDEYISQTFTLMHEHGNPEIKRRLESAQFQTIGFPMADETATLPGLWLVTVRVTLTVPPYTESLLKLYVKMEGGKWKYCGDSSMFRKETQTAPRLFPWPD